MIALVLLSLICLDLFPAWELEIHTLPEVNLLTLVFQLNSRSQRLVEFASDGSLSSMIDVKKRWGEQSYESAKTAAKRRNININYILQVDKPPVYI